MVKNTESVVERRHVEGEGNLALAPPPGHPDLQTLVPRLQQLPVLQILQLVLLLNIFAKDNKYFCTKILNIYSLYLNIHWNSWEADGQVNKSQGPNNTKNKRHCHSSKGCCPQHGVAGKAENYSLGLDLRREVSRHRHRTDHLSKCLRQTYLMNIVPPTEIIMLAREAGMETL